MKRLKILTLISALAMSANALADVPQLAEPKLAFQGKCFLKKGSAKEMEVASFSLDHDDAMRSLCPHAVIMFDVSDSAGNSVGYRIYTEYQRGEALFIVTKGEREDGSDGVGIPNAGGHVGGDGAFYPGSEAKPGDGFAFTAPLSSEATLSCEASLRPI